MIVKHFPNDSALSCKIVLTFYVWASFIETVVLNNYFNGLRRFPIGVMLLNKCFHMLFKEYVTVSFCRTSY